jgi:glycosyltransferase involved in cell wall biosynthesis
MQIIILQPHIPHYREEFFEMLSQKNGLKVYCYENDNNILQANFEKALFKTLPIKRFNLGPFMWYNPFKLVSKDSNTIVLMLDFKHLATWILLLTPLLHKKEIILWGQGISIRRYLKDERKPLFVVKWMMQLANGVWFYTEKEKELWQKWLPDVNAVALDNTISGLDRILEIPKKGIVEKEALKRKYNIEQPIVFVFCARFTENRRVDLLLEVIKKADKEKFAFIIIGEGVSKPSFEKFSNVYDFGRVYDFETKTALFSMADIYFQPAWLGLSIVEAMAYGLPVFSFKRSATVLQCVEYHYVREDFNGHLFSDCFEMIKYLENIKMPEISLMGDNAKDFVTNNLTMESMVKNALSIL